MISPDEQSSIDIRGCDVRKDIKESIFYSSSYHRVLIIYCWTLSLILVYWTTDFSGFQNQSVK